VIAVPLYHPDLNSPREGAGAGGEYPLLTLPEQRQSRHSGSTIASLQVERSGSSNGTRISLPRSVSIEIQRRKSGEASPGLPKLDKGKGRAVEEEEPKPKVTGLRKRGQSISNIEPGLSFDKGKGKATMSTDIERGRDTQSPYTPGGTANVPDNVSLHSGIGAALSSNNTSIIGSDGPPGNPAEEWGPQHPCFPHMNPHVPLSSQLYQTTRIIRIRRDWMLEGDLAPTFSNLYPEILDPAGVSEQDFRQLVEKVNNELIPAFNPWSFRNILDAMLGLVTGWIWDDLGFTAVKGRLRKVEDYLEEWNREMEDKVKDGSTPGTAPRIVPLRRTGYMNVSCTHFHHIFTTN
jgi:Golgin subfamily A member 7/ERF4 family